MFEWIADNTANIVIITVLLAIVGLAVFSIIRRKKSGKSSCGCDCGNCPSSAYCHTKDRNT
ncbi:MAG: FeoB-associated Cys-rich membrane protein [Lachnospiraceae bacterium]|nr:FeoB-associated Cys-rich membrane protein [Lachnospiraceae bacterium]